MKLLNDFCTIEGGDTDTIRLRLNPDHPIYHAHFPGNPITPGVCIVQIVGELLGERLSRQFALSKIVNLKFVSTISPVETPMVEVHFDSVELNGSECKAKGVITAEDGVKTKFSILYDEQ